MQVSELLLRELVYVANKVKACNEVGLKSTVYSYAADTPDAEVEAKILALNADSTVHGILVQLPLPKGQASTLIEGLRCRIKMLEAMLKAVRTSRDTMQAANAQLRIQIDRQRREIDKATGRRTA